MRKFQINMTNYLTKLISYVTNRTEARADSDSIIDSHIEHDVPLKKEKEASKKKLEEFLKLGSYHQTLLE